MGECEEVLPRSRDAARRLVRRPVAGDRDATAGPRQRRAARGRHGALPALRWPDETIARHTPPPPSLRRARRTGPGAEMETSRGCPYHCTFCAKDNFRDIYRSGRWRPCSTSSTGCIARASSYVYFIDEIFLPDATLLRGARAARTIQFGVQTRIDLWTPEMLDLLGEAGCVSIEAGVESITAEGRALLDKRCRLTTDELGRAADPRQAQRAVRAGQPDRTRAATIRTTVEAWRDASARARRVGQRAGAAVPLSRARPTTRALWGAPDDDAWERAHDHYLGSFDRVQRHPGAAPVRLAGAGGDAAA